MKSEFISISLLFACAMLASCGDRKPDTDKAYFAPPTRGSSQAAVSDQPDALTVLRDLLGTTPSGELQEFEGFQTNFWRGFEFAQSGTRLYAGFVWLKPVNERGEPRTCHACAPLLGAVTYQRDAHGWSVIKRDVAISEFGSNGEPPDPSDAGSQLLGGLPAVLVKTRWSGQGYESRATRIFLFQSAWKDFARLQIAENNSGSSDCEDRKFCWGWTGRIEGLDESTTALPMLTVVREGTLSVDGKVQKAVSQLYLPYANGYGTDGQLPHEEALPTPKLIARTPTAVATPSESSDSSWFSADVNFSRCISSRSPADRMRIIQDSGSHPSSRELPDGGVEIGVEDGGAFRYWTYYRTESACVASLPKSQVIPKRYE